MRFVFHGTYQIPGKKMAGQLLEGWSVNSALVMNSRSPAAAIDASTDLSATGLKEDPWSGVNLSQFQITGNNPIPCYGVAGSTFAKSTNCATVANVTLMPAACQAASAALPTGPTGVTGTTELAALGCYQQNGAVLVPPALGTIGNENLGALHTSTFRQLDMSVTKKWRWKERYSAEFRAEFFNILNRTQYSGLGGNATGLDPSSPGNFGQSTATANGGGGIVEGSGSQREMQLGLKFAF